MSLLHYVVDCWHRRCITSLVLRGEKTGGFGPNKGQSVMCVDLLRKVPLAGWFFVVGGEKKLKLPVVGKLGWMLAEVSGEFVSFLYERETATPAVD